MTKLEEGRPIMLYFGTFTSPGILLLFPEGFDAVYLNGLPRGGKGNISEIV